jgi:hypothetical protein
MEAKDYTNIAGSPFQPYVQTQIEQRKKIVSEENRTYKELQWLTNKNAWIRISSGVDVTDDNIYFKNFKDDALSRKYILQAGLTDHSGDSFNLRSGLGPDGAYNIGGTDINEKTDEKFFNTNIISSFGFRPMPGLTNLTIGTGGKLGTLREATFEFTCYNLEQLNIMDALYMKLGFSVLIEWGHIPFLDKNGELDNNPRPLNFYNIKTKEELMVAIQEKRVEHSGNYDAMWGVIKNFSYSFEGNGEFKCKVDLVGAGDVLESLKINQSGTINSLNLSEKEINSPYSVISNANLSLLNEVLYKIFTKDIETINIDSAIKWEYSSEYYALINPYFKKLNISLESIDSYNSNTDILAKYGYQYSIINQSNTIKGNGGNNVNIPIIKKPLSFYSRTIIGYDIDDAGVNNDIKEKGLPQVYITLGHLLVLIMATGGLYDKSKITSDASIKPYFYIDVNPETNRCYTFPGHCSLDPTVCLIASEKLPFNIDSTVLNKLRAMYPFYDETSQNYGGKFMWTLVNINFITSILSKYQKSDNKGDVNFVDFIQDILNGISKACGGFNEFRIVPDDDTRCIRIFDDKRNSPPLKSGSKSPYTVIPVLGKDSLAYSFNYTSKISPNTATQIVIGAQAQPSNLGEEALAFSHLSKGLINRLSPARSTSTSDENQTSIQNETETAESRYKELRGFIEDMYNAAGTGDLTADEQEAIDEAAELNRSLREAGIYDEHHHADGTVTFSGPKY